jgi:hypothetical protein
MSYNKRRAYLKEILRRYKKSSRQQKKIILDEFCAFCHYNHPLAPTKCGAFLYGLGYISLETYYLSSSLKSLARRAFFHVTHRKAG